MRVVIAGQCHFANDLAVEEFVAELLHAQRFDAEALRALRRHDGAAVAVNHALARVAGIADVAEILAGGLDGTAMRAERIDRRIEAREETGHGCWNLRFEI